MSEVKNLWNMRLFDLHREPGFDMRRVPGGWVLLEGDTATFIPYNPEFKPHDQDFNQKQKIISDFSHCIEIKPVEKDIISSNIEEHWAKVGPEFVAAMNKKESINAPLTREHGIHALGGSLDDADPDQWDGIYRI